MRIKEDILACSAAELNYGLAQFVREITRPNGERYEPDSIYYLCLGIQQVLLPHRLTCHHSPQRRQGPTRNDSVPLRVPHTVSYPEQVPSVILRPILQREGWVEPGFLSQVVVVMVSSH